MGFIMDGLDAEAYDRAYSDRDLLRRIGGYFGPYLGLMGLVSATVALNALMDAALPVLVSQAIDVVADGLEAGMDRRALFAAALPMLTLIAIASVLSWTFNFVRQTFTARVVGDVVLDLRRDAVQAVLARDLSFFDKFITGKIVSRVTSDTQDFATVVTLTPEPGLPGRTGASWWPRFCSSIDPFLARRGVRHRAGGDPGRASVPPHRARHHPAGPPRARRSQRDGPGVDHRHPRGQGVSSGRRSIYETFDAVNRRSFGLNLQRGLVFSAIFPVLGFVGGLGTAAIVIFGGQNRR